MAVATTPCLPADLPLPAIIDHQSSILPIRQLKRIDRIETDVDLDPRVRETLGVADTTRPLVALYGDTVDIDNNPVGQMRGWKDYVYADEALDVARVLDGYDSQP